VPTDIDNAGQVPPRLPIVPFIVTVEDVGGTVVVGVAVIVVAVTVTLSAGCVPTMVTTLPTVRVPHVFPLNVVARVVTAQVPPTFIDSAGQAPQSLIVPLSVTATGGGTAPNP
jgi:hypothetical protein